MEKLTIKRLGEVKTVNYTNKKTGQPDSFFKVGMQTEEYGDRWFDLTFRGAVPVSEGQSYEFEISSREYNGKTYYDAKMPRKAGGMSDEKFARLMDAVNAANTNSLRAVSLIQELAKALAAKKVIDDPRYAGDVRPEDVKF